MKNVGGRGSRPVSVLVFDPDEATRTSIKQILSNAGYNVTTAGEGKEALQTMMQADVDVLVSSLNLSGMSGDAFLREARAFWPWVGVVLLAGEDEDQRPDDTKTLASTHILRKPVDPDELIACILEEAVGKPAHREFSDIQGLSLQTQLNLLRRFSESAFTAENFNEALRNLSLGLTQVLPCAMVGVLDVMDEQNELILDVVEPVSLSFVESVTEEMFSRYEALSGRSMDRDVVKVQQEGVQCGEEGPQRPGTVFSIPIITGRQVEGMMMLAAVEKDAFTKVEVTFLYHAANYLSTVLVLLSKTRRLAVRDSITGVYNRRGIKWAFERVWEEAYQAKENLGVVILDVDHFKTVNDSYGHPVGDDVLREFSGMLQELVEGDDVVGRFGGDELVVILPNSTDDETRAFAERLLAKIRSHVFCEGSHALHVTATLGAASCIPGKEPVPLLRQADKALYQGKRTGRDRLCMWSDYVASAGEAGQVSGAQDEGFAKQGRDRVLVVDDDPAIRTLISKVLSGEGYEVAAEPSGGAALERLINKREKFDVALVDIGLAGESGLDLMEQFHRVDDTLVRVVITGQATADNAIASLRSGAYDFIGKPFTFQHLLATVGRAMKFRHLLVENRKYQQHLEEMVRARSAALSKALNEVEDSYLFTLRSLAALADAHERSTAEHSVRVSQVSGVVARSMKLEDAEVERIEQGALLHDIGKIGIPDAILLKPGPLTEEEWAVIKRHPEIGHRILSSGPYMQAVADIVYQHQERYDGSGYPQGLSGEEISVGARIFAIADAYDAMRSDRSYSKAQSADEAVDEIKELSGKQFDPAVVEAFLRSLPVIEKIADWTPIETVVPRIDDDLRV